ncbi:MAG: DUF6587 family protein [Pseudomonadota bacterium]
MIQQLIVAAIVIVAFAASVWKLMPARRRLRALLALDSWAAKHPALSGWRERSLKPRITRAAGTGCAGCAANVGMRPHDPPR